MIPLPSDADFLYAGTDSKHSDASSKRDFLVQLFLDLKSLKRSRKQTKLSAQNTKRKGFVSRLIKRYANLTGPAEAQVLQQIHSSVVGSEFYEADLSVFDVM